MARPDSGRVCNLPCYIPSLPFTALPPGRLARTGAFFGGVRIDREPVTIDLRADKTFLLGQLSTEIKGLRKDVTALKDSNDKDHEKIFARLAEGDKDMLILKISRCFLGQLDRYGIARAAILAGVSFLIGYKIC